MRAERGTYDRKYRRLYKLRVQAYLNGERHMVDVWQELARKAWR